LNEIASRIEEVLRDLVMEQDFVPLEKILPAAGAVAGLFEGCVARHHSDGLDLHAFLGWHNQESSELAWRCDSLRRALEGASHQIQGRISVNLFLVAEGQSELGAMEAALAGVKEGHFLEKILIGRVAVALRAGQLRHYGRVKARPALDWFEEHFLSSSGHLAADAKAILEQKEGDDIRTRRLLMKNDTWATWILIGLNCIAFVAELYVANAYSTRMGNGQDQDSSMDLAMQVLGANQGQLVFGRGQWWRLLSCMFLHANLIHLLINMLSLFNIGSLLERFAGSSKFLLLYFVSGLTGSFLSAAFSNASFSLGASGAIMGLAGALLALKWRRPLNFPESFAKRIYSQLVGPVALTFALGIGFAFWDGPVHLDNWAHFGGILAGFLMVFLWPQVLQKAMRQSPPM
jgi:membrane associated rhomboid family serine protease